jgi:hypothetical protein
MKKDIREITKEYLDQNCQNILKYFDSHLKSNDIWFYFSTFYRKYFNRTSKESYIKVIFQEIRNFILVVFQKRFFNLTGEEKRNSIQKNHNDVDFGKR